MSKPTTFAASIATIFALSTVALFASAFSSVSTQSSLTSSTKLYYRSLHHGPDVGPLTDVDRLGADATKMDKDQIQHYGPSSLDDYVDTPDTPDLFDGGDSEMGLFGDGQSGLNCYSSHHMATTLGAKSDEGALPNTMSYSDELVLNNPNMDTVRAQQLNNWANQREISMTNSHNYMNNVEQYDTSQEEDNQYDLHSLFEHEVQAGHVIEREAIVLRAPVNSGTATHELMVKNIYMGFAPYRAAFVGDDANEWSVTPNDGVLKSSADTQFIIRYTPHNNGVSRAHFVIETEDFVKTWKVVGSTGEYEF
jgi:hypothetical protein